MQIVTALVLAALALPASAAATPFSEVANPHGRGTVILLHSGGWAATGRDVTLGLRPVARRFARLGFRTVTTDYAAGPAGLVDVQRVFDAERARRPRGPICLYGESAGGMWALTLARMRDVRCVIAAAAAVDLADPQAAALSDQATRMLGGATRSVLSPVAHTAEIGARVLLANARDDWAVPLEQGERMQAALGSTSKLVVLEPGAVPWVHTPVSRESLRRLHRAEARWLRAARG